MPRNRISKYKITCFFFKYKADAAFYLAKVYGMKGNNTKSIEFYQQHFDSAKNERQEKNRKLIDKARVYLGMAKANVNISKFFRYYE